MNISNTLIGITLGAVLFIGGTMVSKAEEPVAVGYTPGEAVPVRVVCKNQEAMRTFIEAPRAMSKEVEVVIKTECLLLPFSVNQKLLDCIEGPVLDPTINNFKLSVCRINPNGTLYYIALPYEHPKLTSG